MIGRKAGAALAWLIVLLGLGAGGAGAADPNLTGRAEQGGLLVGRVAPGDTVSLDDRPVPVDGSGRFLVGFRRDAAAEAVLAIRHPDGAEDRRVIAVQPRVWPEQRVDGLPAAKARPDPTAVERIRAENARVAAIRARPGAGDGFGGGMIRPAQGIVSGVFGSRRIYNGEAGAPHSGLDIAAPAGAPVVAAAAGTVVLAEADLFLTGGTVMIDHGLGLISSYAHLSRLDVGTGQAVAIGQVIGAVGATGLATGPHLHWGVSWLDVRLDPEAVLTILPRMVESSPNH